MWKGVLQIRLKRRMHKQLIRRVVFYSYIYSRISEFKLDIKKLLVKKTEQIM